MRRDKKDEESNPAAPYENIDKSTIVQEVFQFPTYCSIYSYILI
jgi:hypothetical protein